MKLGQQGKDKLTEYKGTIIAICHYLTGCDRILLIPKVKKDGSLGDGEWFDDVRIEVVKGKMFSLPNKKNGADIDAPKS